MSTSAVTPRYRAPWNKGKLIGAKPPLELEEVRAIRIRLQLAGRVRDVALFDLATDSKLRGCNLVRLRVSDIAHGGRIRARAMNLRAIQLLLGHTKLESTVRYLGIEVEDALEIADKTEV